MSAGDFITLALLALLTLALMVPSRKTGRPSILRLVHFGRWWAQGVKRGWRA